MLPASVPNPASLTHMVSIFDCHSDVCMFVTQVVDIPILGFRSLWINRELHRFGMCGIVNSPVVTYNFSPTGLTVLYPLWTFFVSLRMQMAVGDTYQRRYRPLVRPIVHFNR
jgi:hypothetical protein